MHQSGIGEREPAASALGQLLGTGGLRSVYQPIVDLETGAVFGFEGLARGPEGSTLERPDQLFQAARAEGRLAELDEACQRTAIAGARTHAVKAPLTLFVNAEPDETGFGPLPDLGRGMRGVVELTERTLTNRLAELLPAVQRARADGWGVALDDVGADTRSLALMPVLRPDVIKLDLRLVQERPTPEIAAIAGAVGAQAERTGATVVAEGIETQEHLQYARALGATLGQGFHFGRPTPEPRRGKITGVPLPLLTTALPHPWQAPFDLASARRAVRRGTLSVGIPPNLRPGLRGVSIRDDDPFQGTWNVVVLGAHFAAMLAAREDGRAASEEQQAFDFVVTYDREIIVECAQALMLRIALSEAPRPSPDGRARHPRRPRPNEKPAQTG